MKYYDKLIFDLSKEGRQGYSLPSRKWNAVLADLPAGLVRGEEPALPQVSELDAVRHYTNLSQMNFGVDSGFYPLGSCTMKYNPKINEEIAAHPGLPVCILCSRMRPYRVHSGCMSSLQSLCRRLPVWLSLHSILLPVLTVSSQV